MLIRYVIEKEFAIVNKKANEDSFKEISNALNIFADYLFGRKLSNNVSLLVRYQSLGCNGMVSWADNNYRPRDFEMLIDPHNIGTWKNLILTLAHEMIHIKQYVTGELFQSLKTSPNVLIWLKKEIVFTSLDEFERPWEMEAYGREEEVAELYWNYCKNNN